MSVTTFTSSLLVIARAYRSLDQYNNYYKNYRANDLFVHGTHAVIIINYVEYFELSW